MGTGGQCIAQSSFQSGKDRFNLPSLSITGGGESLFHPSPVMSTHPAVFQPSIIDLDHRRTNPIDLAAELVVILRVVPGIRQQRPNRHVTKGLFNGRLEILTIGTGPRAHQGGGDQMTAVLADGREFCPFAIFVRSSAFSLQKMPTDVMVFQTCRVDAADMRTVGLDQAAVSCRVENCCKQALEDVFFSIRWWAFCKVVKCGSLVKPRASRIFGVSCRIRIIPR